MGFFIYIYQCILWGLKYPGGHCLCRDLKGILSAWSNQTTDYTIVDKIFGFPHSRDTTISYYYAASNCELHTSYGKQ